MNKGQFNVDLPRPSVQQIINVFVSSICGNPQKPQYDTIRAEIKDKLELDGRIKVYLFEDEGASILSAEEHYLEGLKESNVCIFLIDNADGISAGVQKEIEAAQKYDKRCYYYFCDERSKDKTELQKDLEVGGSKSPKFKIIHHFEEFANVPAEDLKNDISMIFKKYCDEGNTFKQFDSSYITNSSGKLIGKQKLDKSSNDILYSVISRNLLNNVSKSQTYFKNFILRGNQKQYISRRLSLDESSRLGGFSTQLDDWCVQFLPVLFESKSIKAFNVSMFLEILKECHMETSYQVVELRWKSIQKYFDGNIEGCIELMNDALRQARNLSQPNWVIKDILIDIRNMYWIMGTVGNKFTISEAQKELDASKEDVYYPLLDRLEKTLYENYQNGLYNMETKPLNTIEYGGVYDQSLEILAQSFIIAMFNGSLTHMLLIYDKLRDFLFYLSCSRHEDRSYQIRLFQILLFDGKERKIREYKNSHLNIVDSITANEAKEIMEFCGNHPVEHEGMNSLILAFGSVGYSLNDVDYKAFETHVIKMINDWLSKENRTFVAGQNIFKGLSGVSYRMSQNILADICCRFMDIKYYRSYGDLFTFIGDCLDLRKMSKQTAINLVNHIEQLFEDKRARMEMNISPYFLLELRLQDSTFTEKLDQKIFEYLPKFYKENYIPELVENDIQLFTKLIQNSIKNIQMNNRTQGKNGVYFSRFRRDFINIKNILLKENLIFEADLIDSIVAVGADTVLNPFEYISTKLDAALLLICVILKYPDAVNRNNTVFEGLYENKAAAVTIPKELSGEHDDIIMKIGMQFLYITTGKAYSLDLMYDMVRIQQDTDAVAIISAFIADCLAINDFFQFPPEIEELIFQYSLKWLHTSKRLEIRKNAMLILLSLLRDKKYCEFINKFLRENIEQECVPVKILILHNILAVGITEETKHDVILKCKKDASFMVREICNEEYADYI